MIHVVYVILNHETNQAYAGLTKQFAIRIAQHRRRKQQLFDGRHTIIKTGTMSAIAALRKEAETIRFLRLVGYRTVNVAKTGVLGAPKERYWTKERCAEEASKYETRADFRRNAVSIYSTSQQNGWIDEICSHMALLQNRNGYWTKERCAKEASFYKNRNTFKTGASSAYGAARREGWLDDICHHMMRERLPKGHQTKERCATDAAKYTARKDFRQNSPKAYNAACRNGWLEDVCTHMQRRRT